MRQVPKIIKNKPEYLLIGSGKMARHLSHYFSLLNIPHKKWSRKDSMSLNQAINGCSHILLAISDDAIEPFVEKHAEAFTEKTLIHFSGATSIEGILSAHPLMTFSNELYDLEDYENIFFVCDKKTDFKELFPGLCNKSFQINTDQKALYHALIVIAGNFPQILWSYVQQELGQKMDIPMGALKPYIEKIASNFIESPESSLTGPLVRGDSKTLQIHNEALKNTLAAPVYGAISNLYHGGLS